MLAVAPMAAPAFVRASTNVMVRPNIVDRKSVATDGDRGTAGAQEGAHATVDRGLRGTAVCRAVRDPDKAIGSVLGRPGCRVREESALITGGTGAVGRPTAAALAELGATPVHEARGNDWRRRRGRAGGALSELLAGRLDELDIGGAGRDLSEQLLIPTMRVRRE